MEDWNLFDLGHEFLDDLANVQLLVIEIDEMNICIENITEGSGAKVIGCLVPLSENLANACWWRLRQGMPIPCCTY